MLTIHLRFKLTNFNKALAFQILEVDTTFWANLTALFTVPHATTYTASNGIVISFGSSSNISTILSNAITLSNTTYNLSTVTFANDATRDISYEAIVSAIKELVIYVLNHGVLPHTCHYCFNFYNYTQNGHFCRWLDTVTDNWNIDINFCSKYNVAPGSTLRYEVYEL